VKPDDWRLVFEGAVATIAVLGFALSLGNLGYVWWTNRPHVRVKLEVGFIFGSGGTSPTLFILTAANVGRIPVVLTSAGVDLRVLGDTAVFIAPPRFSPPLPHTPDPGHAWTYHIADALADLGNPDQIRGLFIGFQRYLYEPSGGSATT
jgi:hypothetical protein